MTATPGLEGTAAAPSTVAKVVLWGGLVMFITVSALLVVGAMTRREAAEFTPTPIEVLPVATGLVFDTITIDARDADGWKWFSFDTRSIVASPSAGWDLGFRRFSVVSAAGAVDLGRQPLQAVRHVPSTGFVATDFARDTTSAVFEEWYRYNFFSHLLEPRGHTYVVQTRTGGHAKVRFLGYYCPELSAGCVTFEYAYQPEVGAGFTQ